MKLKIYDTKFWIKDVELHPNFDFMTDYERWYYIYRNKLLHREDGPARIDPGKYEEWFLNGLCHRIDGPAIIDWVIWSDRPSESWCLNDFLVDGEIYKKIQNSSKEELLVYMINSEYKYYLPLIEYKLSL